MDIDELIATARPRIEKVRICARGDLAARHEAAVEAYHEALSRDDSLAGEGPTAEAAAVKAIEDEQDASTVEFTVQAVSRQQWADLLVKHSPSKAQQRAGHAFDPGPFAVSMVAACVVDPPITPDQAQKLSETLHNAEWNKLENVAFWLNTTGTPAPKLSAATELLQANGRSSTTSVNRASPEGGSLAGSGEQ